jgi:hypothetical protein
MARKLEVDIQETTKELKRLLHQPKSLKLGYLMKEIQL